jgi:hypothetical protein
MGSSTLGREMIASARKTIDEVLCKESEACFYNEEWMELTEAEGIKFEDGEKVEWAMAAVLRRVKDAYAASLYLVIFYIYSAFSYLLNVYFYIDSRIF